MEDVKQKISHKQWISVFTHFEQKHLILFTLTSSLEVVHLILDNMYLTGMNFSAISNLDFAVTILFLLYSYPILPISASFVDIVNSSSLNLEAFFSQLRNSYQEKQLYFEGDIAELRDLTYMCTSPIDISLNKEQLVSLNTSAYVDIEVTNG